MSFGGWNDSDDAAEAAARRQHATPSPTSPSMLSASSKDPLGQTKSVDISDLLAHPERNTAGLPDAWKPESVKEREAARRRKLEELERSSQQQQQSSVDGSSKMRRGRSSASAKFAAAARFTVSMQRVSHNHGRLPNQGAGSMHQPTHDDDLAAYIQSKEERKREKEAAKQLQADAHVPAHVKQQIRKEIRSRGAFKEAKQYGYTEPVSLPLHRRLDHLSRIEEGEGGGGPSAATAASGTLSARGGASPGRSVVTTSSAMNNNSRSTAVAAVDNTNNAGSVMYAKRSKPEWNSTTSDAAVRLMMPVARSRSSVTTTNNRSKSNNNNNGRGAGRSASTHAKAAASNPNLVHVSSHDSSSALPSQQQQQQHQQHQIGGSSSVFSSGSYSSAPPLHNKRGRKSIDYVAALGEYGRSSNNDAPNQMGRAEINSHPRGRRSQPTTVQQYLNDIKSKESAEAQQTALPEDASKIVDQSVEQTQTLRERVKACREELDHLTLSGEALRAEISAGAPAARRLAQLQQVKTKLTAEKRQREVRVADLEKMTVNLIKRLDKQQAAKREAAEREENARHSSMFPPISSAASYSSRPAAAAASGGMFLTEVFPTDNNDDGEQSGGNGTNKGTTAAASFTAGQIQKMHRRVDELKLHRDALVKERDRRFRAASAAFEHRHARVEQQQQQQQQRRAASLSAPPRHASRSSKQGGRTAAAGRSAPASAYDEFDDGPAPPKPMLPSPAEQKWIDDQCETLGRSLQHDLDKEMRELQKEHERARNFRRREAEKSVSEIAKNRERLAQKLEQLSATAEQHSSLSAEQKMAQAALDSQVSEKQQLLRQLMEQRQKNEVSLKKVMQQTGVGKQQLEKLRQELLVAENVPVQKHLSEDSKRTQKRSEMTQRVAALRSQEKQILKHISDVERKIAGIVSDTQLIEANPATRDPNATQLDAEATLEESQLPSVKSTLDAANQRLAGARQRIFTAQENRMANEKQDQEIAQLTKSLEGKRAKLNTENAKHMEMLEKLDRAERLLSLSGGIAGRK